MMDLRIRLEIALAATHRIERELGGGGMSRVFLAEETRFGRKIVVKLLANDLGTGAFADRFQREIRLAAQLQHPHIVPLLTAGEIDGVPYYTMPFVEGASLRARMTTGRVPHSEAVTILRDVLRALSYAHGQGVVHRDVKPENVLLAEGAAVVTDFGVARALSAASRQNDDGASTTLVTAAGVRLGTPAYMAPEQMCDDGAVDHRADLYAFGVMAYELLAGQRPFAASRSTQQVLVAHLTETPLDLTTLAPALSPALAATVMRCLAKAPADRPASAAVISQAFDAPLSERAVVAAPVPTSVAVLPFVNLSSDPENEYLSDGITDEIIGTLGRISGVRLAGRASCFALKGHKLDAAMVGERLRVSAVVDGSLRRMGNRVRVSAELINAADGYQLWSERFDRDLSDVFQLQDDIAHAVAAALTPRIGTPQPRRAPAIHGEAYRLYMQSLHITRNQFTPEALTRALSLADQAIAVDPSLARAHAARANVLHNCAIYGARAPREVFPEAQAAIRRALALDGRIADAQSLDAQLAYFLDWDWTGAERGFRQALALDPNDPPTVARAAVFFAVTGRTHEAAELARQAVEFDPLSPWTGMVAGIAYRLLRRFADSTAASNGVLALNPHHAMSLTSLGITLCHDGQPEAALQCLDRAGAIVGPAHPLVATGMCSALVALGRTEQAREVLGDMIRRYDPSRPSASQIAYACAAIGEIDDAFGWLSVAEKAREFHITWIAREPAADPLRADPRFAAMLTRMGLPEEVG